VKIKDEQAQVVDTFTYLEVVTSVGGYDVDIKNTLITSLDFDKWFENTT
jgi:hypothetical protein